MLTFYMIISFSYEWLSAKPSFKKEDKGNLEMALADNTLLLLVLEKTNRYKFSFS